MKLNFLTLKRLLLIVLLPVVAYGLFYIVRERVREANATGGMIILFNGNPLSGPIFDFDDFKPGDCIDKTVVIKNTSHQPLTLWLKAENIDNADDMAAVLPFSVESSGFLYGGPGDPKTLADLFAASADGGIELTTIPPMSAKSIKLKVCFEIDAGNEYQQDTVKFDLTFYNNPTEVVIPGECAFLEDLTYSVIQGTNSNDTIKGTSANELIILYGGNDGVKGEGGHDCIVLGDGVDQAKGGDGNDVILGGGSNDFIDGNGGEDTIYGEAGNDFIDGADGDDLLYGGLGNDKIDGDDGDDTIYGEVGNDLLDGGLGGDTVYGGEGSDNIAGGGGEDKLYGDGGNDLIRAGIDNDFLDGGADIDNLNGQAGTDTCVLGETLNSCEL